MRSAVRCRTGTSPRCSGCRELDLERLIARERCRQRDLAVAMICQRLLAPGSKLSCTRRFGQSTLGDELELGEVTEAQLLSAMDWLLARQQRIERTLARRHLDGEGFVLYDLSCSYVEGRCCPLAALGHPRDGKKGKLQVNWGLVCSPEGRPVSVQVHSGNTADPKTLPGTLETVRERFGIERVVFVGDRAMITHAHAQTLKDLGAGFVSALKTAQTRSLLGAGELQLWLFDEANLAEIQSEEFPGERLVVCRNPHLASERARKREALLAATETELQKVKAMVKAPRGRLKHADAGKIGERTGRVINKYKVAKHFELQIAYGAFHYQRKHEQIEAEAALDGIYVLRTTCPEDQLSAQAVVRVCKQLKMAERAYRTMKSALEVRPIHHHLKTRVRAHFFLCMLAYYIAFELAQRLAPLLFTDDQPLAPAGPVAPAQRSNAAKAKASSARTQDGHPAHSLTDLLAELATICRNELRIGQSQHTFKRHLQTPHHPPRSRPARSSYSTSSSLSIPRPGLVGADATLEGVQPLVRSRYTFPSRLPDQAVWQYRRVPSLSGLCSHPRPTLPVPGCPQLQRPAATGRRWISHSTRSIHGSWHTACSQHNRVNRRDGQ